MDGLLVSVFYRDYKNKFFGNVHNKEEATASEFFNGLFVQQFFF